MRREWARFRGREVNTAGDGFLIAFDGPGRAIRRELSISAERVGNPGTPVICLTDRKPPSGMNASSEALARVQISIENSHGHKTLAARQDASGDD